ncbi:NADP-dependent oxidoreductase [Spirillospora sp. NPDC048911]|uniref:NADP-dependent oxidoreductase n=1 Tax=Spirillospora sp. NPDC048911 TaxID=3364527 RepID=UPI003714B413
MISREIRLASRPTGEPSQENFELAKVNLPEPAEGQILVRNTWMSVDPYMRGRMDDAESYIPPFQIGAPLEGSAVGEVIASNDPGIPAGATVTHFLGWREHVLMDAADAVVIDTAIARPQDYLGALGTTGLTAYLAVTEIAPVKEGNIVFVSGAAGAVGSVAGQLARRFGAAKVIGSAGGPEKTRSLVEDFGFDVAIDYRTGALAEQLAEHAPEGVDVYVDNVGGDHLEAAIDALKVHGHAALVGMISGYNAPVPGPRNIYSAVTKRLTLRGVLVSDHLDRFPEYIGKAAGWLADGTLHTEETVVEGLENAPEAFFGVLRGANTGKMLVRL